MKYMPRCRTISSEKWLFCVKWSRMIVSERWKCGMLAFRCKLCLKAGNGTTFGRTLSLPVVKACRRCPSATRGVIMWLSSASCPYGSARALCGRGWLAENACQRSFHYQSSLSYDALWLVKYCLTKLMAVGNSILPQRRSHVLPKAAYNASASEIDIYIWHGII